MQIEAGMMAPEFEVKDVFGEAIRLENYQGKKLLLAFFRFSACALCNLRVHQLIEHYADWKAQGLELVAVFESPQENILQYVGKQDAPFPIIADPKATLYDLYGVETSEEKVAATMSRPDVQAKVGEAAEAGFALTKEEGSNFFRMPAEFLIGPDARVMLAHYSQFVYDHLPFEVIEEAAEMKSKV